MTHRPMQVVARLAGGIGHGPGWTVSLDGLLAGLLWAEQKASDPERCAGALQVLDPVDLDLPLSRCELGGPVWHWAATCGWPDPVPDQPDVHLWTGRLDDVVAEKVASGQPKVVSVVQGRYRTRMMPLLVSRCSTLTWTAVGDIDRVRALLAPVRTIGKKRSHGEGQVLSWQISPVELDEFSASHLSPGGDLARPAPPECLAGRPGIRHGGHGLLGVRPPVMHPARRVPALLPAAPTDHQENPDEGQGGMGW